MQLILNKFGAKLSVRNGAWHVRAGETEEEIPFHKVKGIVLHPATALTWEVVSAALERDTDVIFMTRRGDVIGRLWGNRFGSIASIRRAQLVWSESPEASLWVQDLVLGKMRNMVTIVELLMTIYGKDKLEGNKACAAIQRIMQKIEKAGECNEPIPFDTLRGFEGSAARIFFSYLGNVLPDQYRFSGRSQHPATDPFNAMLNYTYGILYGKTESALLRAGIDPSIGVMHRDEYNRPVLVYDFIEPFRTWADYTVIFLCMQEVFFKEFFKEEESGSWWVDEPAKRILIRSFHDYLDEVIEMNGLVRSRSTHIELEAQRLATTIRSSVNKKREKP